MFVSSIINIAWFKSNLQKGLTVASGVSQKEYELQILRNFEENIDFKF